MAFQIAVPRHREVSGYGTVRGMAADAKVDWGAIPERSIMKQYHVLVQQEENWFIAGYWSYWTAVEWCGRRKADRSTNLYSLVRRCICQYS